LPLTLLAFAVVFILGLRSWLLVPPPLTAVGPIGLACVAAVSGREKIYVLSGVLVSLPTFVAIAWLWTFIAPFSNKIG
jgi:hypothetical protein